MNPLLSENRTHIQKISPYPSNNRIRKTGGEKHYLTWLQDVERLVGDVSAVLDDLGQPRDDDLLGEGDEPGQAEAVAQLEHAHAGGGVHAGRTVEVEVVEQFLYVYGRDN